MKEIIFSLLLSLHLGSLCAEETGPAGTLIVSYQTGMNGERLDRIRFILTDEQRHQQMYPKTGGFVEDLSALNRVVVIEGLPAGDYELEFVIPNIDGLFEEIPLKQLTVNAREVVKIDQFIPVRYSIIDNQFASIDY